MSGYRITKIICPSCEGSGIFSPVLTIPCMWCRGEKRLPVEEAIGYANNAYNIGGGGFICGDHDFDDMVRMEREAEAIYDLCEIPVPWQRRKAA